ncbi:hypothetical protein FQA39_LY04174 [Lamprigera yunnana]|nr:hypothetical protein FQA39_LY04174 [Lamprigera yunnana]
MSCSAKDKLFSPYENNGGTIIAIAGDSYAIIGSDTRLSKNPIIYTRRVSKLFKITNKTVLGCSGCWCDILTFTRLVNSRLQIYKYQNNKTMSTEAVAQMISTMLYYKRFFPYYASYILAGLDNKDKGCVYSYDPIGHFEKTMYTSGGTGATLVQPILDNQIGFKNMLNVTSDSVELSDAVTLLEDTFMAVAERDIYTGDSVDLNIITKDGIEANSFDLRKD